MLLINVHNSALIIEVQDHFMNLCSILFKSLYPIGKILYEL
jgi:hypothetical protein